MLSRTTPITSQRLANLGASLVPKRPQNLFQQRQLPRFQSILTPNNDKEKAFKLGVGDDLRASNLQTFSLEGNVVSAPVSACMENPEINSSRPGYLDNQSTTPLDPRVLDEMLPWMVSKYGNPHSRTHMYGWESEAAVEEAREKLGNLVNAKRSSKELIWTSGATESNNLVIKGVVEQALRQRKAKGDDRPVHIITTQIEHKCILASCREVDERYENVKVTYLGVDENGLVKLSDLEEAIIPGETVLVSVIYVHNEIGVIQDLKDIVKVAKKHKGILVHSDMAQSIGKIPVDVQDLGVDLASFSGHKLYGPKGVGALYISSSTRPRIRLVPQINGGGQERGIRSGTIPSYLTIGMGAAAQLAKEEMEYDHKWISYLSNKIFKALTEALPNVELNGDLEKRYAGNLNLSFDCVEGESLIMSVKDVCCVSSGSACTSSSLEPSYVLRAIGVSDDLAHTSLRFGIGRFTTEEEVDMSIDAIIQSVTQLRELSPLWELKQQGLSLKDMENIWT